MLARKSGGLLKTAYSPRRIADFLIDGSRLETPRAGRLSIHAASNDSKAATIARDLNADQLQNRTIEMSPD